MGDPCARSFVSGVQICVARLYLKVTPGFCHFQFPAFDISTYLGNTAGSDSIRDAVFLFDLVVGPCHRQVALWRKVLDARLFLSSRRGFKDIAFGGAIGAKVRGESFSIAD